MTRPARAECSFVAAVSVPTPLERWQDGVYLKREDAHELGAFKWRGALPAIERWGADVVAASTGNHGAATAWAAKRLGLKATIFVPEHASATKLALIRAQGADLRQVGADFDEAKDAARAFAAEHGFRYFEDGDEEAQLDGYAKIGQEILEQMDEPPAAVIVPLGNGALLAGVARGLGDGVRIVGVAAEEAPVMVESWRAGHVVESDRSATIADGLAVRVAIPLAVDWIKEAADELLLVSEDALRQGVTRYWEAGIRAEPSAAAALAALPLVPDRPVVLIVTGRNIDNDLLESCLAG
jgi:threonine dehydratase